MNKVIVAIIVLGLVGFGFYVVSQKGLVTDSRTQIFGDIQVTALEVLEDSRCPSDVQCIWAGRVVVKTELKSGQTTKIENMELGSKIVFANKEISLTEVTPYPKQGDVIEPDDYKFKYTVR